MCSHVTDLRSTAKLIFTTAENPSAQKPFIKPRIHAAYFVSMFITTITH
jgi:hypothetical protein